jgi:hypothetical protein
MMLGVISKNLCVRRANAPPKDDAEDSDLAFFDLGSSSSSSSSNSRTPSRPKIILERAFLVNGEHALSVPRTHRPDLLKTTLLKAYVTHPKDKDIAAGISLPDGFAHQIHFPFKAHPVNISLLPTLSFGSDSPLLPWTVYTPTEEPVLVAGGSREMILAVPKPMNYVEFLLHYAARHQARIDYSILFSSKPLLFGKATLRCQGSPSVFYFARLLSCKELVDHKLIAALTPR